jgi:hypothetical protein
MDMLSGYSINAPDVVAEEFNGEMVVLNLANGHYYSLRGIACSLWTRLIAGYSPQSILTSLESRRPELVSLSSEVLERMIDYRLVLLEPGLVAPDPIREEWSGDEPKIEVFDDLAELVAADPVHDVDELVGWPKQAPV